MKIFVRVWRQTWVKSKPLLIFLDLSTPGVHTSMADQGGGKEGKREGKTEGGKEGRKVERKELGWVCSGLSLAFLLPSLWALLEHTEFFCTCVLTSRCSSSRGMCYSIRCLEHSSISPTPSLEQLPPFCCQSPFPGQGASSSLELWQHTKFSSISGCRDALLSWVSHRLEFLIYKMESRWCLLRTWNKILHVTELA